MFKVTGKINHHCALGNTPGRVLHNVVSNPGTIQILNAVYNCMPHTKAFEWSWRYPSSPGELQPAIWLVPQFMLIGVAVYSIRGSCREYIRVGSWQLRNSLGKKQWKGPAGLPLGGGNKSCGKGWQLQDRTADFHVLPFRTRTRKGTSDQVCSSTQFTVFIYFSRHNY